MKNKAILFLVFFAVTLVSCDTKEKKEATIKPAKQTMQINDGRLSLNLNAMQKQHQLKNMRSHLKAVQDIILLLSKEHYDKASKVAYTQLGSTTEMKLMCASFGNKTFENLGLDFHKSADKMSNVFKNKDKKTALQALSNTMNYCVQCHAAFRQ